MGDYPFELLGDERFQQLCQAILLRQKGAVQCFPIGQPDGGRDALILHTKDSLTNSFTVCQIKFSQANHRETEAREWLYKALRSEISKVQELANRGAKEYWVMTNVSGTGHLDTGSIDKLQKLFDEELPIPARCMWRDDISRILDSSWDLKWRYPELMTGSDLIRSILEAGLGEDRTRRQNAIKNFVQSQLIADRQVRFRQVELESQLLDLFIDVPLVIGTPKIQHHLDEHQIRLTQRLQRVAASISGEIDEHSRVVRFEGFEESAEGDTRTFEISGGIVSSSNVPLHAIAEAISEQDENEDDEFPYFDSQEGELGSAAFFLSELAAEAFPHVVLEGAPGQGKSTVTQFLCQVHRLNLVGSRDFDGLPAHLRPKSVRLPIRADLRDLASWLSKRNPFSAPKESEQTTSNDIPSLESFLAALIRFHSGGASFDVSDLQEVARISSILLVLDGLDEVADPSRRASVVTAIEQGVGRLSATAASLQVIVTSRPAAFANSAGLSNKEFPKLELGAVTRTQIESYATAWLRARNVGAREAQEFLTTLTSKIDLPHLRDLARNPMQLAILLSLLNTKGVSLPEKRTSLYESYIDVFFGRESEKSETVRKNRELLMSLHGYFAWLLHSESELASGDDRGRITLERLQIELKAFLAAAGHDVTLGDSLFTGVVERVVALVSRTQGTFEFEVQPLREFFAARHLYKTSRYSNAGCPQKFGTKPDRFDAICRKPYWLNVTRFFAGFSDVGELPMLYDRLGELASDPDLGPTQQPALVISTLLSDWVFSQSPKIVSQAAALLLQPDRFRIFLAGLGTNSLANENFVLADGCGREILVRELFRLLTTTIQQDFAGIVAQVLVANSSPAERLEGWRLIANQPDRENIVSLGTWLLRAELIDILGLLDKAEIVSLLSRVPLSGPFARALLAASRPDILLYREEWTDIAIQEILDGARVSRTGESELEVFARSLDPSEFTAHKFHTKDSRVRQLELDSNELSEVPRLGEIRDAVGEMEELWQRGAASEFGIAQWTEMEATSEKRWGKQMILLRLAMQFASLRTNRPKSITRQASLIASTDLLDQGSSLVERVLFARQQARNPKYWRNQLELSSSGSDFDRKVLVALMSAWAPSRTFREWPNKFDELVQSLSPQDWSKTCDLTTNPTNTGRVVSSEGIRGSDPLLITTELAMGIRSILLLAPRIRPEHQFQLHLKRAAEFDTGEKHGNNWVRRQADYGLTHKNGDWRTHLETYSRTYKAGATSVRRVLLDFVRNQDVPIEISSTVVSRPQDFPQPLLASCDGRVRLELGLKLEPIASIASEFGWFNE